MDLYKKYNRKRKVLKPPWVYKKGEQLHLAQRLLLSPLGAKGNTCYKDTINICYQFYIDKSAERQKEIVECLARNVSNPLIDKIYLLNEKIYTDEELGIKSDKIIQKNIHKRLTYKDLFDSVDKYKIEGYVVLCNADIFFDNTLENLFFTDLSLGKIMLCQLRFEYIDNNSHHALFGAHINTYSGASADAWIFHSKFNVPAELRAHFDFPLGIPMCELHFSFLMYTLRYILIKDPYYVRIFHHHQSGKRNYGQGAQAVVGHQVYILPYKCTLWNPKKGVKLQPFQKQAQ
jgi:hypothetical protein